MEAVISKLGLSQTILDNDRYWIKGAEQIRLILGRLLDSREMISAFFNEGNDLQLTLIVGFSPDGQKIYLDYGSNEAMNQKLLSSEQLSFVTQLDGVFIHWTSHIALESGHYEDHPVFINALPDELLYLQRREYFRLMTDNNILLTCRVFMPDNSMMEIPVGDIGMGGLSLQVPQNHVETFAIGTIFSGCEIEVPDLNVPQFSLCVKTLREVPSKKGEAYLKVGCKFLHMTPKMPSLVQRLVAKLERVQINNLPKN